SSTVQTVTTSGSNVAPITVNGGPTGDYVDAAFTSVTVCVPGTSTCQTIGGILVDTGSSGLRVLSSALSVALTQQNASDGNPVVECLPFVSGYTWGPVQTADIEIASEKASSVPIQVLSDTDFTAPTACTDQGTSSDTLSNLGANGIIGVGLFPQDCGTYCEVVEAAPNFNPYYECPSSTGTCQAIGESLTQQVQNPVALFTTDNNGVIVELPAVSGAEATVTGSLVFGIGTESNNALGSATVYQTDADGNFTTSYKGVNDAQAVPYSASFIDSGSNGFFFLDSTTTGIPACGGDEQDFYCPASTANISATNQGTNSASGTVTFSVANADTLFANEADSAFGDLGGDFSGAFDWGLPFFFGRNVYVAIYQTSAPNTPYWAY
ncbi:MAG: DUF3443 family protein, partial [Candidatus Sulfotelmatobacter sp.]